jgi:transposase InsO family protein
MNIHKNARLTLARRMELVKDTREGRLTPCAAAAAYGVSELTARKWVGRFLAEGEAGLLDRSSRPRLSPQAISPAKALAIVELRRRRLVQARIAASVGVSKSTVGRVLARAGLSHLRDLEPTEPVLRYEHAHPGDLVHIDTKKLGRIERMGHRITGNPRDNTDGAGWEFLFVAIDDHARIGFTDMYPNEGKDSAEQFLGNTVAYFQSLGVRVRRILTDNGPAFRSKVFAKACRRLGLKHSFTRAYRPQTNGKAERFIQSALREWAYGIPYNHSSQRIVMLERWIHHYNWHRPHQGIQGVAPISRLAQSRNNLLTLHIETIARERSGCCFRRFLPAVHAYTAFHGRIFPTLPASGAAPGRDWPRRRARSSARGSLRYPGNAPSHAPTTA